VYLWDAVAEVILATLWAVAWVQARQARSEAGHKRR